MRSLRWFVQQVKQRRSPRPLCPSARPARPPSFSPKVPPGLHLWWQGVCIGDRWQTLQQTCRQWLRPYRLRRKESGKLSGSKGVLYFLLVVLCLTSVMGYRFYSEPQLAVGKIAPQTLRAPATATVIDEHTTEANRRAAQLKAEPVLKINPSTNQSIYQSLQELIEEGEALRRQAGAFPFVSTSTLSTETQRYVRQATEADWQIVIREASLEGRGGLPPAARQPAPSLTQPLTQDPSAARQVVILELQNYRRTASHEDFTVLKQAIIRARQNYANALQEVVAPVSDSTPRLYTAAMLALTDAEWEQLKSQVRQVLERMLAQGIATGLPPELLENAIQTHLGTVTEPASPLAVAMLKRVVRPNLVTDPQQTRLQAERAARAVEPVRVEIRRGETIVAAGEPISQSAFVLLDHFGMSQREINLAGLAGFTAVIVAAVTLFLRVERQSHPGFRRRDYLLVLLLTLTTPLLVTLEIPATSLPAVGLLLGNYYGAAIGGTVVGLLSLILPLGMEVNPSHLVASAIAGLVGALAAGRMRSREELAILGVAVGVTQGVIYLLVTLIIGASAGVVWYSLLSAALVQGVMGAAWGIVALGVSPYLEQAFDLVTPIRLAELANPNRPLLKRLAAEAPGTFQHTLFVATLAEAAARALGCNVELVRTGTLYHDIGKMHDAQGFIENQMGGPNKHDAINDPWVSAAIIKKHVTEGLVMARKYRLPKAVQSFIPEHQGTMQIAYFYHEAKKRAMEDPTLVVHDADFRYDGPAPQSRETGIVMLADSCEAALRSLKDATPEEALAMVNRVMRARWQDDQLVDSGLTREDLTVIANIFVQVWQQVNHQRIAYPKLMPTPQPPASVA